MYEKKRGESEKEERERERKREESLSCVACKVVAQIALCRGDLNVTDYGESDRILVRYGYEKAHG